MFQYIRILFFLIIILGSKPVLAQKESNIWYFGGNAGITFSTNPPTYLTDGMLASQEGCATICDNNGNLLFYTDGVTVWNKIHAVMDNGTGLHGNNSSTQSSIIVHKYSGNN